MHSLLPEERELPYTCPVCPPSKKPKCSYNTRKGVYHCFRCGSSGRADAAVPHSTSGATGPPPGSQPLGSALPTIRPLSRFAHDYLRGRGVAEFLIQHLPIYSTDTGILFSFPDQGYWQERNWSSSGKPRWLGPSSPRASDGVVYHLTGPSTGRVVLVEGIGDALRVASAGYATAALLSKRLYSRQAALLAERYPEAVLLLDRDVPLSEAARTATLAREFFQSVRIAHTAGHKDPGAMPTATIRGVLG